jgi:diguanylate cyclase (GGDEF)-like protein/PAS domain S-box-containing protein
MKQRLLLSLLLFTALACAALLFGAYSEVKREAVQSLNAQQTTLARQASQGIQDFFAHHRKALETLGHNPHIVSLDPEGKAFLRVFLSENSGEVLALTRMDAQGRILFSTPDQTVTGRDVSGQAHVRRLLSEHKPVVSDVFLSVQGYPTVALHVPVFQGQSFQGSLAMLIAFDTISRRYLEGIRVAESGYAFVFSEKGVVLFSPVTEFVGHSVAEVSKGYPQLAAMAERMLRGESGEASFSFGHIRNQPVAPQLKHAVFLPIRLENTFWSICVATPEFEVLASLKRFRDILLPLGAAILAIAAFSLYLIFRHFLLQREIARRHETETALRQSENKYRSVIEHITDVFYRTNAEGLLDMVSPSGVALLGYGSEEEMLGRPNESFWMRPEERAGLLALLREHGEVRDYEIVMKRKDGSPVHVSTSSRLNRDEAGKVLGVEGTFRDITERKLNEAALQESVRQFNSLFDNMTEGVALHTLVRDDSGALVDYTIQSVNKSFERILGFQAEKVKGRLASEVYGTDAAPFLEEFASVALTGTPSRLEHYFPPMGKHFSISIAPWADGGFSTIFADITAHKQLEQQLLFRALHDPLTGLANRTLCLDRIAQANERAARKPKSTFAVVFIDLDRFKVINDSLGHEAGDLLLREVAQRLVSCARKVDTVCRYGGDEFTLVMEELTARETVRTIKRVRESLRTPMTIGSHEIQVEASYGVAYAPQANSSAEDLLRNANIALHQAKLSGRNRIVAYRKGMHEAAIQTMSLQSDMLRGLEAGEFFMVYQSIFHLKTGRLAGFEALMRWRHPQRGLVSPLEFIPLAEESGLIFELGSFALNQACQDMVKLLLNLPVEDHLTISVNLSPRQFSRQGLADQIEQTLLTTGLPPSSLVLEITESSIMKHPEASANILYRLKGKGVGIAIDDFGTGYSSMSALQKLPLDRLKVDMSFVSRMTDSSEDREIVRAIITLARSLRLLTVAEGVETDEQRAALRDMHCDLGQGYLCSRPMPLADVPKAIRLKICAPSA